MYWHWLGAIDVRKTIFITAVLVLSTQAGWSDERPSDRAAEAQPATQFSVAENSAAGTTAGTMTSDKAAETSRRTYSLTGGNEDGAFEIDAKSGQIRVKNPLVLDHEAHPQFVLEVTITKADNNADSLESAFEEELRKTGIDLDADSQSTDRRTVTIIVEDVNEAPVLIVTPLSVSEQSPHGTVVGRVAADDPDADDHLIYLFNNDNAPSPFAIDRTTGEITVVDPATLDFEATPYFDVDVVAIDAAGAAASGTIRIDLSNVNEPPQLAAATFTLPEDSAAATFVGRVTGTDPDHGDQLTYTITGGNDDGAFVIDEQTGDISLAETAQLDFEQTPQRTLQLQVRDRQGAASNAAIQIELTNVNEPPIIVAQKFSLPKAVERGSVIGKIVASDPDQNDVLIFSITGGNDDGGFAINPQTGELTVADPDKLNARDNRRAELMITVADQTGELSSAVESVDLGDAPASPSLAAAINALKTQEDLSEDLADSTDSGSKAMASTTAAAPPVSDKRAAASWMVLCVTAGTVLWGGLLVFVSLRLRRASRLQRQALAAIDHDEELLRDRLVDLEGFCNELRAERDELMATRRLLTGEFEKLKSLMHREVEELKSTDTALQLGEEILQRHVVGVGSPSPTTDDGTGSSLQAVRREFAVHQQRLGELKVNVEQRDRELIDTCAKMDARLEEVLQKTSLINMLDDAQPGDGGGNPPSPMEEASHAAAAEWDQRQAQIQELEHQFAGGSAADSTKCMSATAVAVDEPIFESTEIDTSFDDDAVTEEMQQKWAARSELNTLREVANQSTRTVLAKYSRKKMFKSKLLLSSLIVFGVSFAIMAQLGGLGTRAANASLGWGSLGTAAVAAVLLGASYVQAHKKR